MNLWCDARVSGRGTKRKRDDGYSVKQHERNREAEYYKQFIDRYKTEYTTSQYCMWSKMLASGLDDKGLDEPPLQTSLVLIVLLLHQSAHVRSHCLVL